MGIAVLAIVASMKHCGEQEADSGSAGRSAV